MFLLIFESIGTSELILIGIVALIIFGPRKLPQMARTIGKTMADFRRTTQDFKTTWEKEVDFEEERKIITQTFEETKDGYPRDKVVEQTATDRSKVNAPEIKEISAESFNLPENTYTTESKLVEQKNTVEEKEVIGKQDWL